MQLSAVLDTAIGISFTYFLLSTGCSAVAEGVATMLKKRGKYLLRGLRDMLDSQPAAGPVSGVVDRLKAVSTGRDRELELQKRALAVSRPADASIAPADASMAPANDFEKVLAHPLVASQLQHRPTGEATRLPSYLSSRTVATAIVDALVPNTAGKTTLAQLTKAIAEAPINDRLKQSLLAIARRTQGGAEAFVVGVETWYDDQMARVSGFYKRWAKRWIIVIAVAFVLVLHIDAIALTSTLWNQDATRQATVALATPSACDQSKPGTPKSDGKGGTSGTNAQQDYLSCLSHEATTLTAVGVPIGPPDGCGVTHLGRCLLPARANGAGYSFGGGAAVILGLLLSVLAASFGAPFWFGVLNKASSLRTTGDKPASSVAGA